MAGSGIFYPAASGDDGRKTSAIGFDNTSTILLLGRGTTSYLFELFVRFPNVNIPLGAIITNAFIRFTAYGNTHNTTCNERFHFNDTDDAVAPTTYGQYDALVKTTASVQWNAIGNWVDGNQYDSPDIAAVLQEVIDHAGWSSSNAVMLLGAGIGCGYNAYRCTHSYDNGSGYPELHVIWEDPLPETTFTFSDPIPVHLSTVYGSTEQLQLTTTVSGAEESYTYDADFYDGFGSQIGTGVSGVNSGSSAISNAYFSTPSGINYNWYVTVTSSGVEDTSPTYTFSNRFLYEGYVTENSDPINRTVRLYYRNTGELIDSTTSSGVDGYYKLGAVTSDEHFIVAFDDEAGEDYNSLILDRLLPSEE